MHPRIPIILQHNAVQSNNLFVSKNSHKEGDINQDARLRTIEALCLPSSIVLLSYSWQLQLARLQLTGDLTSDKANNLKPLA